MPSLYVSPEPAAGSLGPTIFICVVVALAAALSYLKKKRHLEDKHSSVKESASSSSHGSWTRPPKSPLGQRSITAARDLAVLRPPIMQMSPPSPPSPQFLATQFSPCLGCFKCRSHILSERVCTMAAVVLRWVCAWMIPWQARGFCHLHPCISRLVFPLPRAGWPSRCSSRSTGATCRCTSRRG